jgi:hypothetical protein
MAKQTRIEGSFLNLIKGIYEKPTTHACNPSYSEGRDQEDRGSRPAQENSLRDPISKNPLQIRAGAVAQGVGPEFKPQYHTHTKMLRYKFLKRSIRLVY